MMIHRTALILLAAVALAACTQEPSKTASTSGSATSTATPAAPAPKVAAPVVPASATVVYIENLDITKATTGWKENGKNVSAEGNPIKLNGKSFDHAFGTHAEGVFVINVKGAAKSFSATVGVDDDAEDTGSVGFYVYGDGKLLAHTDVLRPHQAPKVLTVDLTGVQQLVLKCDDGGDGVDNDHADWADAKITLDPAKANMKPEAADADTAKM